jgi:hypothetical protein
MAQVPVRPTLTLCRRRWPVGTLHAAGANGLKAARHACGGDPLTRRLALRRALRCSHRSRHFCLPSRFSFTCRTHEIFGALSDARGLRPFARSSTDCVFVDKSVDPELSTVTQVKPAGRIGAMLAVLTQRRVRLDRSDARLPADATRSGNAALRIVGCDARPLQNSTPSVDCSYMGATTSRTRGSSACDENSSAGWSIRSTRSFYRSRRYRCFSGIAAPPR